MKRRESIATAHVSSGRADPTWIVDQTTVEALLDVWRTLAIWTGALPSAPGLGYRGCSLTHNAREWHAYAGVVTLRRGASVEARADAARVFERTLLQSAPQALLPPISWL